VEGVGVDGIEPGPSDGKGLGGRDDDDGGGDLEGGGGAAEVSGVGMSGNSTKGASATVRPAVAIVWRPATAWVTACWGLVRTRLSSARTLTKVMLGSP
jgi:hypothetical protein